MSCAFFGQSAEDKSLHDNKDIRIYRGFFNFLLNLEVYVFIKIAKHKWCAHPMNRRSPGVLVKRIQKMKHENLC
jgi:hypothetical protein